MNPPAGGFKSFPAGAKGFRRNFAAALPAAFGLLRKASRGSAPPVLTGAPACSSAFQAQYSALQTPFLSVPLLLCSAFGASHRIVTFLRATRRGFRELILPGKVTAKSASTMGVCCLFWSLPQVKSSIKDVAISTEESIKDRSQLPHQAFVTALYSVAVTTKFQLLLLTQMVS